MPLPPASAALAISACSRDLQRGRSEDCFHAPEHGTTTKRLSIGGEQANAKRDLLNAKWQYFFDGNAVEYARLNGPQRKVIGLNTTLVLNTRDEHRAEFNQFKPLKEIN